MWFFVDEQFIRNSLQYHFQQQNNDNVRRRNFPINVMVVQLFVRFIGWASLLTGWEMVYETHSKSPCKLKEMALLVRSKLSSFSPNYRVGLLHSSFLSIGPLAVRFVVSELFRFPMSLFLVFQGISFRYPGSHVWDSSAYTYVFWYFLFSFTIPTVWTICYSQIVMVVLESCSVIVAVKVLADFFSALRSCPSHFHGKWVPMNASARLNCVSSSTFVSVHSLFVN